MLGWSGGGRQGGIAWRTSRGGFAGRVDSMDMLLQELATYPRWLVALLLSVSAIVVIWIGVKLLKLTLYVGAALVLAATLAGIVLWWLG